MMSRVLFLLADPGATNAFALLRPLAMCNYYKDVKILALPTRSRCCSGSEDAGKPRFEPTTALPAK